MATCGWMERETEAAVAPETSTPTDRWSSEGRKMERFCMKNCLQMLSVKLSVMGTGILIVL